MKKLIAFCFILGFTTLLSASNSTEDPTLMTINGKNISLSEFEYIYNKNNSNNVIDKKTLSEYVDLFVNFKLKVEDAISQGLDTTAAFKSEFGMYRDQLAEQYLNTDKEVESLVAEAYNRTKDELKVMHLLVRIPEPGTSNDTLSAYNKIMSYYKRALKEDFEKLAREVSEDQSVVQNGGLVGWISAFRTPYTFETMAYNTPVGTVSKPVRTFIGYHLVKVVEKRPSQGEVKVAHILLMDENQDANGTLDIKNRVDSIYNELKAGADFGELAEKHSQDPGSASNKGELPWFGSGQMIPEFEKASFELKNKDDFSKPIKSQFGWHIIKLIGKKPLQSREELAEQLSNQVKQTDRKDKINEQFANRLKAEYNFSETKEGLLVFQQLAEENAPSDSLFKEKLKVIAAAPKTLFSYGNKTVNQADFADYLEKNSYLRGLRSDFITSSYNNFVAKKLKEYEISQLDKKYPDYKNLVQEYHDGILLFEVMNQQVWDKATKDTEGLTAFFNTNKAKYNWVKPHYKGRIIHAKDKRTLKLAKNIVKKANNDSIDKYLHHRLNDSVQYVKIEKGLWSEGDNKIIDSQIFKKEKITPAKEYPFFFLNGKKINNPETYLDVRGVVTSEYQDYLEKEWIQSLRSKYPYAVDDKILQKVKTN